MPSSRFLISSQTLGSSAASVTFSSIPATYTDLVLKLSMRSDSAGTNDGFNIRCNGLSTTIYSDTNLYGSGSAVASFRSSNAAQLEGLMNGGATTSNTFSNSEIYLPNYLSTVDKPMSGFYVQENNTTAAFQFAVAHLARLTSAITSITISTGANFVTGSSFYLYGLKNS